MVTRRLATTGMAASLMLGWLAACPAQAVPHAVDTFSVVTGQGKARSTVAPAATAGKASTATPTTPVQWFEAFDDAIAAHKPTAADRVILSRPFNQEAERVQQWTETAAKVAKNYRELAKILHRMTPLPGMNGVKEYRDLTIDWYADAASIYEDLIKPRRPARTMEELEASLNEIKERAQSLNQTTGNLKAMDISLRKTFRVHLARYDDPLQQYVRSK